FPSSFANFVRCCMKDFEDNNNEFSKGSIFESARFLKSASMKAPLYYLSDTLFEDEFGTLEHIDTKDFVQLYKPLDIAVVFSLLYITRRAERMISEHDWSIMVEPLVLRTELGALVGKAIPGIGISLGLLAGAMRSLALATFLAHDEKGFGQYRRALKISKLPYDQTHELERWGCCHPQVCSSMLVTYGFRSQYATGIYNGLAEGWTSKDDHSPGNDLAYKTKLVEKWTEALLETGLAPDITHNSDLYPSQGALAKLKEQVQHIKQKGPQSLWLMKRKEDVTPELTPKLCK
ncbi:MAG: hypothetical protein KDD62_16475, partial [Bdellovibrionales bacterium]|nr:hypothetical protein [Bdellovibrionales bacterium]